MQSHFRARVPCQIYRLISHLETSPAYTRGLGPQPFAHRSGVRAILEQPQKQQCTVSSGKKSQLSQEAKSQAQQAGFSQCPRGKAMRDPSLRWVLSSNFPPRAWRARCGRPCWPLRDAPQPDWFHFSFSSHSDTCETRALDQGICWCSQGLLHKKSISAGFPQI